MDLKNTNKSVAFDNEVSLKEIIELIVSSKTIIFLIILICTSLTSSYVYYFKPTIHQVSAKIIIGNIDESPLINFTKIKSKINFYFGDIELRNYDHHFLELKAYGSSEDEAILKINEINKFIFDVSEKNLSKRISEKNKQIKIVNKQIEFYEEGIQSIIKRINNFNIDNRITINATATPFENQNINLKKGLNLTLDSTAIPLETQKINLKESLLSYEQTKNNLTESITLISKSSLYEPISIVAVDKKEVYFVSFGFILGIMLSIIFLFIRKSYSIENQWY